MDLVYIPCAIGDWFDAPSVVTDADGREHRVLASRMDIVDGVVRLEQKDGLHRVQFRDQTECWVRPSPVWDHVPFGADPINVRDLLRSLASRPAPTTAA